MIAAQRPNGGDVIAAGDQQGGLLAGEQLLGGLHRGPEGVGLEVGPELGVLLQQHGSGIRHGIYSVAKSVQLTGAVARLPRADGSAAALAALPPGLPRVSVPRGRVKKLSS